MPAILVKPLVLSIYEVSGHRVLLPERMAHATPDMKAALYGLRKDLRSGAGDLVLSDLFRSYDMQLQAHLDYATGKKKAYSPPPGGSLHEAGRAFDIDLDSVKMALPAFWEVAGHRGIVPIIDKPDPKVPECWHFECRGSHQKVKAYYEAGKGSNFDDAYHAMAASAIVAVGLPHDRFKGCEDVAYLQSALIRLGRDVGNMDGQVGPKTIAGLQALGIGATATPERISAVDALLWQAFPAEFFDKTAEPPNPFA